jgi:hypothetical protein
MRLPMRLVGDEREFLSSVAGSAGPYNQRGVEQKPRMGVSSGGLLAGGHIGWGATEERPG